MLKITPSIFLRFIFHQLGREWKRERERKRGSEKLRDQGILFTSLLSKFPQQPELSPEESGG